MEQVIDPINQFADAAWPEASHRGEPASRQLEDGEFNSDRSDSSGRYVPAKSDNMSDRMRRIYDRVDYQAQWVRDELDDRDRRLHDVEGSLFNRLSAAEMRGEERYRETLNELEQHSYQRDRRLHDVEGAVSHRLEVVEHREKELNHKMEQVRSDVAQNSQQLSNQVAALQEMVMALIDANTQRHEKQRGCEDDCDQASKVPSQRTLDWVAQQQTLKKTVSNEMMHVVQADIFQPPITGSGDQVTGREPQKAMNQIRSQVGSSVSRRSSVVLMKKRMDGMEDKMIQMFDMMKQMHDAAIPAAAVEQSAVPATVEKPVTPAVTETVKPVTPAVTETVKPVTPAVTETVKPVTPVVTERPVTPAVLRQ
jgi:uncharacterized protein YoxC